MQPENAPIQYIYINEITYLTSVYLIKVKGGGGE